MNQSSIAGHRTPTQNRQRLLWGLKRRGSWVTICVESRVEEEYDGKESQTLKSLSGSPHIHWLEFVSPCLQWDNKEFLIKAALIDNEQLTVCWDVSNSESETGSKVTACALNTQIQACSALILELKTFTNRSTNECGRMWKSAGAPGPPHLVSLNCYC